jgi:hypothetical protein
MGVLAPQPALMERSVDCGNLLTFFVRGERVASLTEDRLLDVILGASWVRGALPFYVYVTHAQQRVQVKDTAISTDAPGTSTGAMGIRAIRGPAGLGLLAIAALVAVCLRHAIKRYVPRPAGPDQRAKLGRERKYGRAYAEHPDHGGDPDFFHSLLIARDRALADADDEGPAPGASPARQDWKGRRVPTPAAAPS